MAVASEFQPQLRLHSTSWLFALLKFVRQFIAPIIAAVFVGARNDNYELWGLVAGIPLVAAALWHQYFYRYGFGPRALVIRDGFLFRNVRQIDFSRIVNVDTSRGPLHRLLGVAEVRIETSAGGKAEASLRVLSLEALAEVRERVFGSQVHASQASSADPAVATEAVVGTPRVAAEEELLRLPLGEVLRFGLIDNRGALIVAAIAGGASSTMGEGWAERLFAGWLPGAVNEFGSLTLSMQVAVGAAAIVAALILMRLISVAAALLTLYDFRLLRQGTDLKVRHGLLTRVGLTLRVSRIQAVHQVESLLHRLFSRVSLDVDAAGGGAGHAEDGEQKKQTRWLAPVVQPDRSAALIAQALPHLDFSHEPQWQPLAERAQRRIFRRTLVVSTVLTMVPLAFFTGVWALAVPLVTVPLSSLHATLYVRYTRWALTADALWFKSGWLTRRLIIAPRNRVQCVRVTQSPFDRRHQMAAVGIDAAGGSSTSDLIRIPYLDRNVASEMADALYQRAGR